MDEERRNRLRDRRRQAAVAREHAKSRASYGVKLVEAVAMTTGKPLLIEDFNTLKFEPLPMDWPRDIRDAPGLVAAYISQDAAIALLMCIRLRIRSLSGELGFHDTPYLGLASVTEVDPVRLLALAEATEEAVLLHSATPLGVLMVDCYYSYGEPFSIVVQGDELVRQLADCFPANL